MKRMLVAILVCIWMISPAFANSFNKIQQKLLERITFKIEQSANDPVTVLFLHQERACIEKATDIDGLADCLSKFSPDKFRSSNTLAER